MTVQGLVHQRCVIHWQREAVARCPQCNRYYCRECVTEHEGRVLCASCIRLTVSAAGKERHPFRFLVRAAGFVFGVLLLWTFFYYLGELLLAIPTKFHDGSLWS